MTIFCWGGLHADQLTAGDGNDLLLGGLGADRMKGERGRDVLIGGWGADDLSGGDDEDVLMGGQTAQDGNVAALMDLRSVWASSAAYATDYDDPNGLPGAGDRGVG